MQCTSALVLAGLLLASTVSAAPMCVNGLTIPGNTSEPGPSIIDGRLGFFSDLY